MISYNLVPGHWERFRVSRRLHNFGDLGRVWGGVITTPWVLGRTAHSDIVERGMRAGDIEGSRVRGEQDLPFRVVFGGGQAEPNAVPAVPITRLLYACCLFPSSRWRRTAPRQVSTCFRERTSGIFPFLLFDFPWDWRSWANLPHPSSFHRRAYGNKHK